MKKNLYFVVFLCLAFYFFGCSGIPEQMTTTIELDGNPTTGYTWVYTMLPEGIVREVSNDYVPNRTNVVGSGGKFIFTFEAITEGATELNFSYLRVWEEGIAPAQTVIYNAIVDDKKNLTLMKL